MKKILIIFLLLFSLCACKSKEREDVTIITIDDTSVAIGYDNVNELRLHFVFDNYDTLSPLQTIENLELKTTNGSFGLCNISNLDDKEIEYGKGVITSLSFYIKDVNPNSITIDGNALDGSITNACTLLNGEMKYEKTPVCVAHKETEYGYNTIYLYSDILNLDQDIIDRIEITWK